jgi:hypothetical protein
MVSTLELPMPFHAMPIVVAPSPPHRKRAVSRFHALSIVDRFGPLYAPFAYLSTQSLAVFSKALLLFLNSSAIPVSTASSGCGAARTVLTNASTSLILFGGFHSSGRNMPKHMAPRSSFDTLGW